MTDDKRTHFLDNLRALAMLAGVLFHAALAYSPLMHNFWITADREQWVGIDVGVWFLHLFRMPLFFAIAGYFAARQVDQRGVGGMLRNRVGRVLLPLAVFWPLVSASIDWFTAQAAATVQHLSPLLELIQRNALPPLPPSLVHLWFLYYLMWFYLLIWIAKTVEWKVSTSRFATWPTLRVMGVAPLLLMPALLGVGAPTPAPESLLPQLWALVFYGLFFVFGYGLYAHPLWLARLRPYSVVLGMASLAAYLAFLWVLGAQSSHPLVPVAMAALQACVSVWMTLWCLQVGSVWMNAGVRWLRYLSDASYWTYLVHLPILFAVQYRLMDLDLVWPAKWAISVFVTLALCLGSYHLIVRGTFVGRMLNGKLRAPEASGAA